MKDGGCEPPEGGYGKPTMESPLSAKCTAELVGTFFLMFTVVSNVHTRSICGAISVGTALTGMVYAFSSVSGGHFNPAVTLAIWLSGRRKISRWDAVCYAAAQLAGAVLGAVLCCVTLAHGPTTRAVETLGPRIGYSEGTAVAAEMLYSWLLCHVVLNVATAENADRGTAPNAFYGLAIGLTVTAAAIAIGPISGCSLNPAVSLGFACASLLTPLSIAAKGASLRFCIFSVLAPAAGAVAGAASFFVTRGGIMDRMEYGEDIQRIQGNQGIKAMSSKGGLPALERVPHGSIVLQRLAPVALPAEMTSSNLICGLYWKMREGNDMPVFCDIDLACVKFGRSGECLGSVYFANQNDRGLTHGGDEIGGLGLVESERVMVYLPDVRLQVQALVFVANIYSDGHTFDNVEKYSVRLMDSTNREKEFCRYEESPLTGGANAIIVAILYRIGQKWYFKAIHQQHKLPPHSSYRKVLPQIREVLEAELAIPEV